jgi:hypothetical protein
MQQLLLMQMELGLVLQAQLDLDQKSYHPFFSVCLDLLFLQDLVYMIIDLEKRKTFFCGLKGSHYFVIEKKITPNKKHKISFQLLVTKKSLIHYLGLCNTAAVCSLKNQIDYVYSISIRHVFCCCDGL